MSINGTIPGAVGVACPNCGAGAWQDEAPGVGLASLSVRDGIRLRCWSCGNAWDALADLTARLERAEGVLRTLAGMCVHPRELSTGTWVHRVYGDLEIDGDLVGRDEWGRRINYPSGDAAIAAVLKAAGYEAPAPAAGEGSDRR